MTFKHIPAAVLAAVILISAGCANQQSQPQSQQSGTPHSNQATPVKWEEQTDQKPAGQARRYISEHRKEVTDVHAINSKKELLITVKLKTFANFSAQQITKKIQKHLQKRNPQRKVQVSSDKKIYQQITKTEAQIRQGQIKAKALKERIKKINKFYKEQ